MFLGKRKRFLVLPTQYRVISLIAVCFIVLTVLIQVSFYAFLRAVIPKIEIIEHQFDILRFAFWVMFLAFVALFVTAVIVVLLTHRMVGPVPRLENELKEMIATGNYHELKVRKTDVLRNLVDVFNQIISKLQESKNSGIKKD